MKKDRIYKSAWPIAAGALCMAVAYTAPSIAQVTDDEGAFVSFEEIIVTGRKREESLQDVPISISVVGANELAELNVLRQEDLAALVPGYHYNQGVGLNEDRTAALPSIRGIGSSEIATNRSKVASFVDGMPILGSVGAINIGGSTQVEVYSGPQSAAFGRSTFAGAINYVTRDPGDTYEGNIGINWSEDGTRIVNGSFGGPITDTLGFQLGASFEDSQSPDTGLYSYADGVEALTETGENLSARFVFEPNDKFKAKLTFSRDTTDDGPRSDFYSSAESSFPCYNNANLISVTNAMGMATLASDGVWECELEVHPDTVLEQLNDYQRYFDNNTDVIDDIINNGFDNGDVSDDYEPTESLVSQGAADGLLGLSLEEQVRIVYDGFSVAHDDAGADSERNRVTAQFDYLFDSGSALQLSLMRSEEDIFRGYSRIAEQEVQPIYFDAVNQYFYGYSSPNLMANAMTGALPQNGRRVPDNDPTAIEENYAEIRWASPGEERLRYVVGASYYDYEFIYTEYGAPGYNTLAAGTADLFAQLIDPAELEASGGVVAPTTIASEVTTNTALFFNASYDFTDTVTGTIEGRYANDDVGAILPLSGLEESINTSTFTPRLSLNWAPTDETTYYVQYSEGVNPAGINANMLDPLLRETLDNGVAVDDTIYGGTRTENVVSVNYDSERYIGFDEEKLTNYEFGFKGNALGGRLTYAGALYFMEWENALENIALDWDYTYADAALAGDPVTEAGAPAGLFYVEPSDNTSVNQILTNTGVSETTGFELQASYQISDSWSISANTSVMDRKFTDYCSEDDFLGFANELGAYAGLTEGVSEGGNPCWELDGLEVPNQPSFSMTVIPRYRTEFGDGFRFTGSATFRHTAQHYSEFSNTTENPAVDRVNLNLGLSKDAWSANIYINNLLDDKNLTPRRFTTVDRFVQLNSPAEIPVEYQLTGPDGETYGSFSIDPNVGRTFGVRLNYDF